MAKEIKKPVRTGYLKIHKFWYETADMIASAIPFALLLKWIMWILAYNYVMKYLVPSFLFAVLLK